MFFLHAPVFLSYMFLANQQKVSEHQQSEHDAVISKDFEVVLFDVLHQELDGNDRYNESNRHAQKQNDDFLCTHAKAGFHKVF